MNSSRLEPAFSNTFIAEPPSANSDSEGSGQTTDEADPSETGPVPLALEVIERLGEQAGLLGILEDKAASQQAGNDPVAGDPSDGSSRNG